MMPLQLQIIAIILAVGFFILPIYLVKKGQAEVRQLRKWLLLAVIILIGALVPALATRVAKLLGIINLTSLALFGLTGVLLIFALNAHISLINAENQIKVLTQELSLMKADLNETDKDERDLS
ncbi:MULTISPECIES: DUF2304 domain-containing protein [Pseudolactococcus]|jgi:hypothetical protein|uniref:DUF2304-containing protein n=1 Tax=Pseudolactococcus piscium MKFS47 TaxID=297352 RepID=A0A0D6E0K4_9LACT|nr:DUF2304-containing protein [Lactococcus piscium MKFS47]SCA92935.1 conserved membrane hypothetical protein [Lactococcus piscium]